MSNRVRVTGWKWGGKKKSNNVREKKRLERNDSQRRQAKEIQNRSPQSPQIRKLEEQTETKNKDRIQDSFPKVKGSLMLNTPSVRKQ